MSALPFQPFQRGEERPEARTPERPGGGNGAVGGASSRGSKHGTGVVGLVSTSLGSGGGGSEHGKDVVALALEQSRAKVERLQHRISKAMLKTEVCERVSV